MWSPWGKTEGTPKKICSGIQWYSTARHGGIHVSKKKNEMIPEFMRNENGWYEEDVEWSKVYVVFKDVVPSAEYKRAKDTLKNWYPDEYERFFNVSLRPGESYVRDKQIRETRVRYDFVPKYCIPPAGYNNVPDGFVGVGFWKEADREEVTKLVKYDEYDPDMVVSSHDINNYQDWDPQYKHDS